jgi:hypothetical protein
MYIYFTQDRITPISINKPHAPLREPASPLVHLALRARLHRLPRHARAQPPHGSRAYDGKEGEDKCGSSASTSWRIRPRNRQYVQKDVDVASWNPCCRRPSPLLVHQGVHKALVKNGNINEGVLGSTNWHESRLHIHNSTTKTTKRSVKKWRRYSSLRIRQNECNENHVISASREKTIKGKARFALTFKENVAEDESHDRITHAPIGKVPTIGAHVTIGI